MQEDFEQFIVRLLNENIGNRITTSLAKGLLNDLVEKHRETTKEIPTDGRL